MFLKNLFNFLISIVLIFLNLSVFAHKTNNIKKEKKTANKWRIKSKNHMFDKHGNPLLIDKDFKSLTMDELEHNRNVHSKENDKETTIRYTERMIAVSKDPLKIGKLRLEIADLYFSIERYDKAFIFYNEFTKMYPGSKNIELAAYKMIISSYRLTLPSDKDQSQTRETIKLANEFISNNSYDKYKKEVTTILNKCNKKLLDHELIVFNFNLNSGNLKGAQKRLEYIKENFFKDKKNNASLVKELEKQIAAAKANNSYSPDYEISTNSTFFNTKKYEEKEEFNF